MPKMMVWSHAMGLTARISQFKIQTNSDLPPINVPDDVTP